MTTSLDASEKWGWKQFFAFSEKIIQGADLQHQCDYIPAVLKKQLGAEARLWLSEVFYPLPGERIPPCVDYGKPKRLVARAIVSRKIETFHKSDHLLAALPLFALGRLVGVLELAFPKGRTLDPVDLDFLNGIAAHCGAALALSRQDAVRDWRLQQLTLLRQVSFQIARQRQDAGVFQRITDLIQGTFNYYFVLLYTFNPEDKKLHYQSSTARNSAHPSLADTGLDDIIPLGKGLVGLAAHRKKEVVSPNVKTDSKYRIAPGLRDTCSEASLPLVVEGRLYGVLDVQSDQLNGFHPMDLVVLRILADNVAAAVEGVRMIEALGVRSRQLQAVTEVSRRLASILDLNELLHQVVDIVSDKFHYPFVHCFILDSSRERLVFSAGTGAISRVMKRGEFSIGLNDPKGLVAWSAREGHTCLANDVTREPHYLENALPPAHTRAEMTVPLKYGEEVLGVLDLQSDRLNAFDEEDRFIVEALAAGISTALRNASLYRTERWRRQVAESYKTIADLFSTQFTLEVIYQAILKELMRDLPSAAAAVFTLSDGNGNGKSSKVTLDPVSVEGISIEKIKQQLDYGSRAAEWLLRVIQSDQPRIRQPKEPLEPLGMGLEYSGDYSAIAAPLWTTDQVLGAIVLVHPQASRYGDEAASMLSTFAGYISIAIQNNQLYTSSVEQAWISTVMLQVAEAAQSAENVDALLHSVARIIPLLIGVDECAFFVLDKYSKRYQLAAGEGFNEVKTAWLSGLAISSAGASAFEKMHKTRMAVGITETGSLVKVKNETAKQYLLLPLFARDELLGAFLVENRLTGKNTSAILPQSDQLMLVFQGIARQTAVALENLQLKERNQSEGYVTAVLLQVAQTVVSSTTFQEAAQNIANILPYLVGVETVLVYLFDSDKFAFQLRGAYSEKWDKELKEIPRHFKAGDHPLLDRLAVEKKPVFLEHHGLDPLKWDSGLLTNDFLSTSASLRENPQVMVALPLLVRNECFGALLVAENSRNFAFREKRFEIIRDVAQQLALAAQGDCLTHELLDNERMKREMQLANDIQRTFLPDRLPAVPGWEVDVHWHPARQVSGDFYDAFQLPDGRFGFVIADVSDKGIPAALYMTVTRTLVHASAMDGESPAKTLYQVNKLLLENSQEGLFTTAFYVLVDAKKGELTYCNAGHNRPAWLQAAQKKVTWLEKGGTALGSFADIELCDTTISFNRGDGLLLYTDGVTEARGPRDRLFGLNRLKDFLSAKISLPVGELLTRLDEDLDAFRQNQPQSDDITLLALRRH